MSSFLPILTFHDIDKKSSVISFQPDVFQRGLARIYTSGFRTLSQMEVVDVFHHGAQFPERCLGITFDDGYRSVYTKAFPELQHYDMSATVFLTVGDGMTPKPNDRLPAVKGHSMLSWNEIREMQRWGIEFGAHTCTHPDLTRIPPHLVTKEVVNSKAIIEDVLGTSVSCFAYPYGCHNHRVRNIVREHFSCAYSDKLGLITKISDPYAFERVDAYYLQTDRLFQMMLTKLFQWYVLGCSIPRRIRRILRPRSDKP